MAKIILKNSDVGVPTNKGLKLDFSKVSTNDFMLDFEVTGSKISSKSFVQWFIFSKGKQKDAGDLTKGLDAELKILRFYAGPQHMPNVFNIEIRNEQNKSIASYELQVADRTQIEKATWIDFEDDFPIDNAGFNTSMNIQLKGTGLAGLPLNVKIYKITKEGDQIVEDITNIRYELFGEKGFTLDTNHFPKKSAIMKWLGTDIFTSGIKLFFTIHAHLPQGSVLLYDGKKKKNFLEAKPIFIEKNVDGISIAPVVVSPPDQYFTQKYEPCKYEKINFVYGEQSGLVFDEKVPTNVRYPKYEISIVAGNNPNADKVEILLSNVDTLECQYNEDNQKYLSKNIEDNNSAHKDHKDNVFDTADLREYGIIPETETETNLAFVPTFPYVENDHSAFLMQFLTNGLQEITIPINTCRYQKKLKVNIYPDALWTLHFNHFVKTPFFYKDKELPLQDNFDQLAIVVFKLNSKNYLNFCGFLKLIDVFRKFVGEEVYKELAENFNDYLTSVKLGLHAQFQGNEGKKTLDYSQQYLMTSQYLIYCNFCFRWILEILFLFLTRGGTLLKLGKKATVIVEKAGRKIKKITDTLEKFNLEITYPAIATNSACYYELQKDGRLALTIEHNVKADPLLGITYNNTFTLEDLIKLKNARSQRKIDDDIKKTSDDAKKAREAAESATPETVEELKRKAGQAEAAAEASRDAASKGTEKSTLEKIAEKAGLDATLTLNVEGTIEQEYNVKINTLTGKLDLLATVGNYITNNQGQVKQRDAVSIFAKFEGNSELKIDDFDITASLKLKGDAQGAISHIRVYGKDDRGVYFQDYTEMSKITGKYMMRAIVNTKFGDWDSNPKETPVPFTAFDKEPIPFPKIYIFKY